jgi:hypothetical protein
LIFAFPKHENQAMGFIECLKNHVLKKEQIISSLDQDATFPNTDSLSQSDLDSMTDIEDETEPKLSNESHFIENSANLESPEIQRGIPQLKGFGKIKHSTKEMYGVNSKHKLVKNGHFDISTYEFPLLPSSFVHFNEGVLSKEELLEVNLSHLFLKTAQTIWVELSSAFTGIPHTSIVSAICTKFLSSFKIAQQNFLELRKLNPSYRNVENIGVSERN